MPNSNLLSQAQPQSIKQSVGGEDFDVKGTLLCVSQLRHPIDWVSALVLISLRGSLSPVHTAKDRYAPVWKPTSQSDQVKPNIPDIERIWRFAQPSRFPQDVGKHGRLADITTKKQVG